MKRKIFLTLILAAAFAATAAGQAKKPTIMVVPSEGWCKKMGYVTTYDNQGVKESVPDYKAALAANSDIRLLITKMGGIMANRDFPMKSLEQEMRNMGNESVEASLLMGKETGSGITESPIDILNRTAKADILIDLDFDIKKSGPQRQVTFIVTGLDAYSAKIISGNTGVSSKSASVPIETLLEESVLSFMDQFTSDLQRHFDDMFENGREVKVTLMKFASSPIDFETEFDYNGYDAELADIIGVWFEENCVEGRFSMAYKSDNIVRFDQVRMPLYTRSLSGREVASDMTGFTRSLVNMLRKDPYNVPVKVYPKGLGEIWLIIGEK